MKASIFPGQEIHRLGRRTRVPDDVFLGVEAHVGQHGGQENVRAGSQGHHADGLPLEVADRADSVGPEQLVAADVDPGQKDDRVPGVHPNDVACG